MEKDKEYIFTSIAESTGLEKAEPDYPPEVDIRGDTILIDHDKTYRITHSRDRLDENNNEKVDEIIVGFDSAKELCEIDFVKKVMNKDGFSWFYFKRSGPDIDGLEIPIVENRWAPIGATREGLLSAGYSETHLDVIGMKKKESVIWVVIRFMSNEKIQHVKRRKFVLVVNRKAAGYQISGKLIYWPYRVAPDRIWLNKIYQVMEKSRGRCLNDLFLEIKKRPSPMDLRKPKFNRDPIKVRLCFKRLRLWRS